MNSSRRTQVQIIMCTMSFFSECRYANGGKFKEGIADFEKALTVKHSHKNARNYLVETQVAYGEE